MMDKLHIAFTWSLPVLGAWCLWSGLTVAFATSGQVVGSEFGMLITIANLLAKLLMWLVGYGVWRGTAPRRIVEA